MASHKFEVTIDLDPEGMDLSKNDVKQFIKEILSRKNRYEESGSFTKVRVVAKREKK
tara:strand:+ start:17419 stop:17589 length:171 start_codon:yes stop_codon:yes gene_type:complete